MVEETETVVTLNVTKIVQLLNSCIKKIFNCFLTGGGLQKSYAVEYLLILAGERIREIIEEIEKYFLNDEKKLKDFLNENKIAFTEEQINSGSEYKSRKFREAFGNTEFGKILLMFSQLRSKIEHLWSKISEKQHSDFALLYLETFNIVPFLDNIKNILNSNKDNSENALKALFSMEIKYKFEAFHTLNNSIASSGKKRKKHLTVDEQKEKILKKINTISNAIIFCNQLPDNKNDLCIIYAKAMCLVVISENAKTIKRCGKDKRFHESIKLIITNCEMLKKYTPLLLSLVHPQNLPTLNHIYNFVKTINDFNTLPLLKAQIEAVQIIIEEIQPLKKGKNITKGKKKKRERIISEKKESDVPASPMKKQATTEKSGTTTQSIVEYIGKTGSPVHSSPAPPPPENKSSSEEENDKESSSFNPNPNKET